LDHVKVLLNHAVEELGWLDKNPWRGLDIPYVTENKRRPWQDAELKAFFGLPPFTAYALPKRTTKNGGPAAYWMPLLGLYTGARVGELAQLRLVDVQESEGVPCISINTEAEGARVKTEGAFHLGNAAAYTCAE
jgi:integrase